MTITERLGFLGFGNMGTAILAGLLERGQASPKYAVVYDPSAVRQQEAASLGVDVVDSPEGLASACDALVIAVKPQQFEEATRPLVDKLGDSVLAVSIMAGVSMERIGRQLPGVSRIARVMPNLPAVVGAGASGVAFNERCVPRDRALVRTIFEAVGIVEEVDEADLDAVTAISGSGPAYFFYLVECMAAAGEAEGLDRAQAERLAAQTALGAGMLLRQTQEAPATLRERVTSKGGTTFAALESLRANHFESVVAAGVAAAAERSRELGQ